MSDQTTPATKPRQATCQFCGKVFRVRTSSKGIFCSEECKDDFRSNRPKPPAPRKNKRYSVYALKEQFVHGFRYIGVTNNPKRRLRDHLRDKSRCHRANWIQSVLARGAKIEMIGLCWVPDGVDPGFAEREWIRFGYDSCWELTNGTSGGDGVRDLDPESRERIRRAWVGRKHTEESRRKMSDAMKGRKHTEEYKDYMRRVMKDRVFTEEHRAKLSVAIQGKPRKRKISDEAERDILRRLANGEKQGDLAAEYGVNKRTIWLIKSGRRCASTRNRGQDDATF